MDDVGQVSSLRRGKKTKQQRKRQRQKKKKKMAWHVDRRLTDVTLVQKTQQWPHQPGGRAVNANCMEAAKLLLLQVAEEAFRILPQTKTGNYLADAI